MPPCHLTDARWLEAIAGDRGLRPWECKVFGEELIYLFYGGIFYRRSAVPTKNAALLPVGFVFEPQVLGLIDRYFPFDTGAAASCKYGDPWNSRLEPFRERFVVNGGGADAAVKRMVHFLFGTNAHYLKGRPNDAHKNGPSPLETLFDFFSADLTDRGVDQRYCRTEGHAKVQVPIRNDTLLWVGFPDAFEDQFIQLCEHLQPVPPKYYRYDSWPCMPPNEAAAVLQARAYEDVIKPYAEELGGTP